MLVGPTGIASRTGTTTVYTKSFLFSRGRPKCTQIDLSRARIPSFRDVGRDVAPVADRLGISTGGSQSGGLGHVLWNIGSFQFAQCFRSAKAYLSIASRRGTERGGGMVAGELVAISRSETIFEASGITGKNKTTNSSSMVLMVCGLMITVFQSSFIVWSCTVDAHTFARHRVRSSAETCSGRCQANRNQHCDCRFQNLETIGWPCHWS